MSGDYVDRYAVLNVIDDAIAHNALSYEGCVNEIMESIAKIPAADVVERKRGEWIRVTEELGESWMCSECMEEFIPHDGMEEFASYAHFCPNCGARMDGEEDV